MSIDEIVHHIIKDWNIKDYSIDYILMCEEASLDEAIDSCKNQIAYLTQTSKFLSEHKNEIKEKLLNYQKEKYGERR